MFEYKGGQYTYEDLQLEAKKQGVEFNNFMEKMKGLGMTYGSNAPEKGLNTETPSQQPFGQEDIEARKRQNKTDEAVKKGLTTAYSDVLGIPEFMVPAISGASAFITGTVGNVGSLLEKSYESSVLGMSKEEMLKDGENVVSRSLGEMTDFLNMMGVEKYDELTGETEDLYGLVEDGRYGDAGALLAYQAFSSAPALAITVAAPVLGSMVLGASTAGESFEESLKNRPDETLENIWYNSLSKGAAEWGTEWAGGKLFRVINNLDPSKKVSKTVADLSMSFGNNVLKKAGLGFLGEGLTEGLTDTFQQGADQLIFGDVKTSQNYIRGFINAAAVGAVMGGGVSGGGRAIQGNNKNKLYHFISPKQWQIEQQKIARQIDNNAKDLKIAKENNDQEQINVFQNNEKKLIELANKNKTDLYSKFDAMSRTEQIKYAEQMDIANKALNVVNNNKYSEQAQAQAKNVSRKAFQNMFDSIGNIDLDVDVEQSIGEALKASEILDPILKKAKGINREDLTIKILNTQKEVDAIAEKEGSGIKKSDGAFIAKGKDGKATIYINKNVAAAAGATNVLGHELLHYMISRKFKTDNKSMAPLVDELKTYLKDNHSDVFVRVQQRIDNFYTNKDGTIKDGALEEYLNVFSDLISKQKIDIKEVNSKGLKSQLTDVMAGFGFGEIKLDSAKDVISFLSTYNKNINRKGLLGKLMGTKILDVGLTSKKLVEGEGTGDKKSMTAAQKAKVEAKVDKLGQVDTDGNNLQEKGTGNFYYQAEADKVIKELRKKRTDGELGLKNEGYLDNLIASKYKVRPVPEAFVSDVFNQLLPDIRGFKPEENKSLFGYLGPRIKFRAGDVYKKIYEKKGPKKTVSVDERTKEGEVRIQLEADIDSAMEALETEDMSPAAQAKKEKADKQRYSEYRQKLGFETGSKIYNEVLDNVKKSLMMAYGATQNITDAQLRAKAIATKLKKEYANLNSPLFKQIKNFLTYGIADTYVKRGTKDTYISNLKKFREDIVKNTSTADLVQMERNTPEADRIFTTFVKTLTSIEQVQDAVNREQLPPDALNKITKDKKTGKGAFSPSLYNKIMPTETELISWADQPGINPVTGARQGLKGTRKDGIAMRMVNSLVTDAIMEARQSEEVQNKIAEMDIDPGSVAELGAAIGREVNVKFSKSNAIGDVTAAMDGAGDINVYSQIKFSKSHREAYEKQLTKRRPDLTEDQRKNAVQSVFDFVDGKDIPNNKKSKYEKMAMHYTANGYLILPEDGYKVIEAEKIATQKKLDPFSFKNPNVLIETYVGEVKGTRTNPDNVKTFSNKTELTNGVTVYDVEDSKQGQLDTRKVIDTHFGEKSNPWCLCARQEQVGMEETIDGRENAITFRDGLIDEGYVIDDFSKVEDYGPGEYYRIEFTPKQKGELGQAWQHWKQYNEQGNGHKIAFQNGRLVSFRDGNEMSWWDRNDKPSNAVVVRGKKGKDGFKPVIEVGKTKETILNYEKVTGDKKNGTTIEKNLDGKVVEITTKKNGRKHGKQFERYEKVYYTTEINSTYKDGSLIDRTESRSYKEFKGKSQGENFTFGKDQLRLDNITKWEKTRGEGNMHVTTVEGTIKQDMFEQAKNPDAITDPFVKKNFKYLVKSNERYFSRQGEKVTVKETVNYNQYSSELLIESKKASSRKEANIIISKAKAEGKNTNIVDVDTYRGNKEYSVAILEYLPEGEVLTINGEVQAPRVKFSNSTIDFNLHANNAKWTTLMDGKRNQVRKSRIAVRDIIDNLPEDSKTARDFFEILYSNIQKDVPFIEIVNATWKSTEHMHRDNTILGVLSEGTLTKDHLANILGQVKRITEVEVAQIGFNESIKSLNKKLKSLRSNQTKADAIIEWFKHRGKAFKTAKVKYKGQTITTNQQFAEVVISDIAKTNSVKGFGFKTIDTKGNTRVTFEGKPVLGLKNITEIKQVFTNGTVEQRNDAAKQMKEESGTTIDHLMNIIAGETTVESKKSEVRSMAFDTEGGIRKIAVPGKMIINYGKKVELDHRPTVNNVHKKIDEIIDEITPENKEAKLKELRDYLEGTEVYLITKKADKIINKYKDASGQSYRTNGGKEVYEIQEVKKEIDKHEYMDFKFSKSQDAQTLNKAIKLSRSANNPTKGITVLDFDDTLATSKSMIRFTRPDGTKGKLNAEQYASTYEDLSELGYKWDFSEFNKVVDGKVAPLFNKAMKLQGKFGPESMFVLTARPAESAGAIHAFLKANGLNIPLKNITGLANSTAEAKALWMAEKVGEGYNDFYFADDALQNVQAVKNMLDQFDVKSKVQQARVKFSQNMDTEFNNILENITGIESKKRFSIIKGRKRGESKGKFRFFIPPSHEDFVGLLYNFMGKGKEGNAHRDFFEQALVRPLNRGYREIDTAKQAIANDYKSLNKQFPDVKDKLVKATPDGDFTFQDAIRVYLWDKHGHKIPGLTETDQKKLAELVMSDPQLQAYAETLNLISKQENYVAPGQAWETANIRIDLVDATGRVGRADYFTEFNENADIIFSEENLNKIEAGYGRSAKEALEDMLHRIKTGVNRPKGASGKPNMFMNWLNASVSGVMFFNTRSALLQQLSNVNFLNFADNNILAAGKAFANQPQYWKDFAMIFNSDMLKQRRGGLGTDINGAELAEAIKKARPDNMFDQVSIVVGKALKLGFLPTQIGDNIAIATGGAAFYRNRVNKYVKDGLSVKEAETKAFTDLQNITQSTQQSARPDMTSQQQASWIGKLVLNFLNTPSQYNRIIKKAGSDIKNRRITPPNTTQMQSDMSNASRMLYYGAAQNLIFYSLQTALFAVMFDDDDEESEAFLKKKERVINGSIDTILRGSGIYGVAISTLKNMMIKFLEQREKGYNKDESAVIMEMLNFSPVVGIKARKIVNAEKTLNYNKKVIDEMETFDIDNPQWSAVTNYVESITTAPVNRLYQKTINLRNAADNNYTALQRALFFSGYTTWSLDLGDTEKMEKIKSDIKEKKKKEKKNKKKKNRFGPRIL